MSLALMLVLSPLTIELAMGTRRRAPVLPKAEGPCRGRLGSRAPVLRVPNQGHAFTGLFMRNLHRQNRCAA